MIGIGEQREEPAPDRTAHTDQTATTTHSHTATETPNDDPTNGSQSNRTTDPSGWSRRAHAATGSRNTTPQDPMDRYSVHTISSSPDMASITRI